MRPARRAAGRASSAYLLWEGGRPRLLIDAGGGSALRFAESGATVDDLDAVLLSHVHVDHKADLPALIKASYFGQRSRPLPVVGPPAGRSVAGVWRDGGLGVSAIGFPHGELPARAFRVEVGGRAVVFSGDTSAADQRLERIARGADLFVAHHAIPEGEGQPTHLHMGPRRIGEIVEATDGRCVPVPG